MPLKAMPSERYDTDISLDLLTDLPNWDESTLIEYINRIARELYETRSQQIQLDRHVEQLSSTVVTLLGRVGSLTHRHEQLDAKVCALVQDVNEVNTLSRQAVQTAHTTFGEVKQLREDMFRLVGERLVSLQSRADELVGSF